MLLNDNFIKLREFKESEYKDLSCLCNNRKLWDNLRDALPSPYTEKEAIDFISLCKSETPQFTFAIEFEGKLAGCIGLVRQPDIYRLSAEMGYWIGEPFWGIGIATHAVKLISEYAFRELGLVRLYAGVFDFNKASQRVLEKAGFKLEAVFEKSVIKNNRLLNEFRYALIN